MSSSPVFSSPFTSDAFRVKVGLAEDPDYREHDLYEPDTSPHGQVYEGGAAPRSATVSRISERGE